MTRDGGQRDHASRLTLRVAAAVLISTLAGVAAIRAGPGARSLDDRPSRSASRGGLQSVRAPLSFEANRGQVDEAVRFLCRGQGQTFFLTPSQVVFVSSAPAYRPRAVRPGARGLGPARRMRSSIVRMRFVGANSDPPVAGLDEQPNKTNYFIGSDPRRWLSGVPNYARVKIERLYPGIDLIYHGRGQQLEYDLVLAPGARPEMIRVAFDGIENLRVDQAGDLILQTRQGELRQARPFAYQEVDGKRRAVAARHARRSRREVGFRVEGHDPRRPLVIDPVLSYSSYLGGGGQDGGRAIAVDGSDNAYVTGFTTSTNFPTQSPRQPGNAGGADVFVAKFNAAGNALVYSTYLGGGGQDIGYAIAVDGSGNAYVTGSTGSTNFPTQSPVQAESGGGEDAFVAKLNAAGSALVYSTYLGGAGNESGRGIAVDGSGSAYVTGGTASENFPTESPLQPSNAGGEDVFVSKIHSQAPVLVYSTYLGGEGGDQGLAIAVDGSGSAHLTGSTGSNDFPTQNPLQPENEGGEDGFVTRIHATGSALVYSTYLGGSNGDSGVGIALDGSGNAYVTGDTASPDFPVQSPFQPRLGGALDAFVTKIDSPGTALVYSTYLGGPFTDTGCGIDVDASGNAYVSGDTLSPDFPTRGAFQATYGGAQDAFAAKLVPSGSALAYSTFVGGSGYDAGYGMAVDGSGSAYFTGSTSSTNFPIRGAYQGSNAGGFSDAFVVRIAESLTPERLQADPSAGAGSDGNGVFEPGETAVVEPWWTNQTAAEAAMTALASDLTGPAGAAYGLVDGVASYGAIPAGSTASCGAASDCYWVSVSAPAVRPARHWDATFTETPDVPAPPTSWTLHLGDSFADVPRTNPNYRFVETIFHNGITGGCGADLYCPDNPVTRAQMAVFLLKAEHGPSFVPPPASGTVFNDVPQGSFAARFIERLAAEGVTAGCGSNNFCPGSPVTRAQMAVFLLKALLGSGFTPPAAAGVFSDVPVSSPFAPWIEELARRDITAGCGAGKYCPFANNSRGQMAVFVVKTFGLE